MRGARTQATCGDAQERDAVDRARRVAASAIADRSGRSIRVRALAGTSMIATARGWIPSKGNLAEIAPGMTIGGGVFTNSEHLLPDTQGRIWYEADFDYKGGGRNAKRILYSNDALIYITRDHYKTIQQL